MHPRLRVFILLLAGVGSTAHALRIDQPEIHFDDDCAVHVTARIQAENVDPTAAVIRIAEPGAYLKLDKTYPVWIPSAHLDRFMQAGEYRIRVRSADALPNESSELVLTAHIAGQPLQFHVLPIPPCERIVRVVQPQIHQVQRGDTLYVIAQTYGDPLQVSANTMMIALQLHNPEAFINQNINLLRGDALLTIPTQGEITELNLAPGEAAAEVARQMQQWRAQRARKQSTASAPLRLEPLEEPSPQPEPEPAPPASEPAAEKPALILSETDLQIEESATPEEPEVEASTPPPAEQDMLATPTPDEAEDAQPQETTPTNLSSVEADSMEAEATPEPAPEAPAPSAQNDVIIGSDTAAADEDRIALADSPLQDLAQSESPQTEDFEFAWRPVLIGIAVLILLYLLILGLRRYHQRQIIRSLDLEASDTEDLADTGEDPNTEAESTLDLAAAYIEIGNPDMAKPLIDRILETGTADEQEKAKQLQARLDHS